LKQQQGALRRHIQSLLRRNGLHYKAETQHKTLWQTHHYGWLDRTVEGCSGSLKVNLSLLVRQLKNLGQGPGSIIFGRRFKSATRPAPHRGVSMRRAASWAFRAV